MTRTALPTTRGSHDNDLSAGLGNGGRRRHRRRRLLSGALVGAVTPGPVGAAAGAQQGANAGGKIGGVVRSVVVGDKTNVFLDQGTLTLLERSPNRNISGASNFDTYEHLPPRACHGAGFNAVQNLLYDDCPRYCPLDDGGLGLRGVRRDNVAATGGKATTPPLRADYCKNLCHGGHVHEFHQALHRLMFTKYGARSRACGMPIATTGRQTVWSINLSTYCKQRQGRAGRCYRNFCPPSTLCLTPPVL